MRKKSLRILSVLLTASLVLSSANTGISVLAFGMDSNVVEEQQVEETVEISENLQEEASEEITSNDEMQITEDVTVEEDRVKEDEKKTEAVTEQVIADCTQEQDAEEIIQEEIEQKLAAPTELVSTLIEDAYLCKAVLDAYIEGTGEELQDSEFTYEKLSSYEGELDFSSYANAGLVTSIKGLGYAKSASAIDISSFTNVTTIPEGEFEGCAFSAIKLPSSITVIEKQAFLECKSLTEITLPDTVTVLGEQVFAKCTALGAIHSSTNENTLPSKLTKLGQQAFLNDTSLKELTIPSFENGRIIQDEPSLFSGCTGLSKITFGKEITTIPVSAFTNAGTESENGMEVVFEEGSKLDKILGSAFNGAKLSTTLDLSMCEKLIAIEESAFEGCTMLSTIILPKKVSGNLVFKNRVFAKTSLTAMYEKNSSDTNGIILPDYLNEIGAGCFFNNKAMTRVSLSPELSEIPDYTFDGCTALAEVEQRKAEGEICKVKAIGDCAFRSTAIADTDFLLNMNQLETIGYQKLEGLSQYGNGITKAEVERIGSLSVGGDSSIVTDNDNQKYSGTGSSRKYYGSEVFTNCSQLTHVSIPSSVKNIGGRAFYFVSYNGCDTSLMSKIQTVTWETSNSDKNVERKIYPEAFHGNTVMTDVILPENKASGESLFIGKYAFYGDWMLNKVGVASEDDKNVLPVTVKQIDEGAFYYCKSLPNITIQSTEEGTCPDLGIKAFEKCLSLKEATVPKEITIIPRHFFYDVPLKTFNVGDNSSVGITSIGALAFFGNNFEVLDLSKYTSLEEINGGAFSWCDTLIESGENKQKPIVPENYGDGPQLTTVILPERLTGDKQLFVNSGVFMAQYSFDTMKIPGGTDGQVYIPDYMYENGQQGIFSNTGVSKVIWQADQTGKNQWKNIPVSMYSGCERIAAATDVLPKGSYVETIGKAVFSGSNIVSADLSNYTALKQLGSGTVYSFNSNTAPSGVFQACSELLSVKLPTTLSGAMLEIGEKTFYKATQLGSVDFGNAVYIKKQAFGDCIGLQTIVLPESMKTIEDQAFENCTNLVSVDFGGTTEIKTKAFSGCTDLTTVEFRNLKIIGNYTFEKCTNLVLTQKGLPNSLEKIGMYAFSNAKSLGEVKLGSNLVEIGNYAFWQSGMTSIDFKNATSLKSIGNYAFSETKVTDFKLENTKVSNINQYMLFGCTELATARFGDEVLYIDQNALAGCQKLNYLEFSSTTTVSNKVFYSSYGTDKQYTAGGGNITIHVVTPEKTVVPLGRSMELPYYINEKSFSKFDYILVGEGSKDESIKEHLSVSSNLKDGYYWGQQSNDNNNMYQITSPYYTKLDTTDYTRRTEINKDVDIIKVTGTKATQGTVDFSIVCSLTFECAPNGNTSVAVTASKFAAKYKIEVKDIPFCANLYEDNNRTISVPYGQTRNIQVINGAKAMTCYFDVVNIEQTDSDPSTYDVVVETDNPDVIYPAGGASGNKQTSYQTTRGTNVNNTTNVKTPNKAGQIFYLIPAGVGTANIKVYPVGHPEYARIYNYVVNSDIQTITLEVPREYRSGVVPGTSFSIFSNYKNCLGQIASVTDMSKYSVYSNKNIVYASSASEYVSVDALGTVTVLKADADPKTVTITATVPTSVEGRVLSSKVTLTVKYPDTKANVNITDAATGATVVVTKVSKKDLDGEVKFIKPADAKASTVTIPDVVVVNGVQYKVTSIAANAFKNNSKIKTVKLGKYLTTIEDNAFYGCKALTKITIPATVTKMGKKAFYNCKKLKTVSISSKAKLTEIGDSAFQNCSVLTKITIPANVIKIGAKAFYNCKKLKTITVKSTMLSSVGANAFKNIYKKATIKVPKRKFAVYKKLLAGKGQKSTVKIKK